MAKQNVLTRSKKNKAEQLFRSNHLQEARALYADVCRSDRTDTDAWVMQGIINRKLGLFRDAEQCCLNALKINSSIAAAHHALGAAVQCQGRMMEAQACYHKAIQLQPDFAEAHYFMANACKDAGDAVAAELHFKKAISLRPDFLEALSNLGALLMAQGRSAESLDMLQRALGLAPRTPQILCNIGALCEKESRFDEARSYFQRALAYAPDFMDALTMLASLEEKGHHMEAATRLAERGLQIDPEKGALKLVMAKIARREGRVEAAIAILETINMQALAPDVSAEIHINLGKLYDRVGKTERAFSCFSEGNRLVAENTLSPDYDRGAYGRKIEQFGSFVSERLSTVARMQDDTYAAPVFLIGFPRSGTTLLEQILDSHPRLQALEEKPTVAAMQKLFFDLAGDNPDALADLTETDIHLLRAAYWDEVSRHIKRDEDALFIDKMPLNLVNAHLIWRVFPNARFILAIRHPCDVCLSCFMQNFAINEAMSVFLSLKDAADLYSNVMGLWLRIATVLPVDYYRIRYEDVVADFEGQARGLLDFLGVGWDDAVLKYDEHAKSRTINTPSYHQVTQPIYQHAKYRWRRYAKQMEPVMGTLRPFIEYFGYDEA